MNNSPIGVFDSGFGGLSVWRMLRDKLPRESLLYFGDGKNCPYGDRSREEICRFADDAVRALLERGCKLIVVACNTATAMAIEYLRKSYPSINFVGLEPAVKPACLNTQSGVVGVLATARSLEGELFRRTASRYADKVKILTAVGEGFVEAVENDAEDRPETEQLVRKVMQPMLDAGADKIVLGCTHYPFLRHVMERVAEGRGVEIIDSGEAVARRTAQLLAMNDLQADADNEAYYEFATFGDEEYRERLKHKAFADKI
ncbi:MAG: glutamate racemase [Alistipes sp.]|nr:glutamate racemase [Alistipes sp.]